MRLALRFMQSTDLPLVDARVIAGHTLLLFGRIKEPQ